jgi:cyclophilin family peptidyl-prolyl cis-trans isomerase
MPLRRLGFILLSLLGSSFVHAQSIPTLVSPLPSKLDIGPAGLSLDLREYFVVPGIVGTQLVQFDTVFGQFNVELRTDAAPRHVANFMAYVQAERYTNTFIHRGASFTNGPVSILQGGGFQYALPFQVAPITKLPPVALEYNLPNARGTLSAARTGDPNSATSEWFFNVQDNSAGLGPTNAGGYSVFGRVIGTGMTVVDAMAVVPRFNAGGGLTELPLRNVTGASFDQTNLVAINSVRPATLFPSGSGPSVVTFTVENGNPAIVQGAVTGSILRITPFSPGSATINVRATDTNGNAAALLLTANLVAATEPPVFTSQPISQTVAVGATLSLNAAASNVASYRWERNGVAVPGATTDTLLINSATAGDSGSYVNVATNIIGSTRSQAATVNVGNISDAGRLVNLSILTTVGSGTRVLTMGAYVGPGDSAGSLPVVIRAVGPTLSQAPFNVPNVLPDPTMTFYSAAGPTALETNDDWGGSVALQAAFGSVAAFALPASSRDSAIVRSTPGLPAGGYTMQVEGKANATGAAIAEIYDASGSNRTPGMPRLINLSTRALIDERGDLAMGFVLGGLRPTTVLIRGVGPSLSIFGVPGLMDDPRIELYDNRTGQRIAGNDDWAGTPELAAVAASVGAFALRSEASKDSVVVLTLPPGPYSVRVSGVNGAGGVVLVEVYEVP